MSDDATGLRTMLARVQRMQAGEQHRPVWSTCPTCRAYADRRREQLKGHLADKSMAEDRLPEDVVDEYMGRVHQRHLDGLPV